MSDLRRYHSFVMDSARWEGFAFREGDVVISTPPKCGTTWTQTICALLLLDTLELPRPLAELSPWLDMLTSPLEEVRALLEAQEHRRFVKTHTPPDGLPWDEGATYLFVGRDPRDVSLSWDHHLENLDPESFTSARAAAVGLDDLAELGPMPDPPPADPLDRFRLWMEAQPGTIHGPSLSAIVDHLHQSWRLRDRPNVALVHYADLLADLPGQVRRIAGILGVVVDDARVEAIADACRFDAMKAKADLLAPDVGHRIWRSNDAFFHHGTSGRWREVADEGARRRYDERLAELVDDPAFVRWLHDGSLAAPAPATEAAPTPA